MKCERLSKRSFGIKSMFYQKITIAKQIFLKCVQTVHSVEYTKYKQLGYSGGLLSLIKFHLYEMFIWSSILINSSKCFQQL